MWLQENRLTTEKWVYRFSTDSASDNCRNGSLWRAVWGLMHVQRFKIMWLSSPCFVVCVSCVLFRGSDALVVSLQCLAKVCLFPGLKETMALEV